MDNIQNVLVSNLGFGKRSSIERGCAVLVVYLLELGLAAVAAKNVLFQHNLHSVFLLHLARKANVHLTKGKTTGSKPLAPLPKGTK